MISLENRSYRWLEKKLCLKFQQKNIRWFRWLMKTVLLITTTKDGCGFSSPGAPLMSTLISQTLWNFFQVVAPRVAIRAFISQQPKKMSWQRPLSKFFMPPNKDLKRATLTVTNLWITLNRQAWRLTYRWKRKRRRWVLGLPRRSMVCFHQSFLRVPKTAIRPWWMEKTERITHSLRQWSSVTALSQQARLKETVRQASFPCCDLTLMTRDLPSRLSLKSPIPWLALSRAKLKRLRLKTFNLALNLTTLTTWCNFKP